MGKVEAFECDCCGIVRANVGGMIAVSSLVYAGIHPENSFAYDELHFCDKACLKKWIDEVL